MEDKITIIEGPPPTFESVNEEWILGLTDGPHLMDLAMTRLRTFNGPALVERCHRAWRNNESISLEYRTPEGLNQETQIVAARTMKVEEGDMLVLWVKVPNNDIELEIGYEDDTGDEEDDDPGSDPYF